MYVQCYQPDTRQGTLDVSRMVNVQLDQLVKLLTKRFMSCLWCFALRLLIETVSVSSAMFLEYVKTSRRNLQHANTNLDIGSICALNKPGGGVCYCHRPSSYISSNRSWENLLSMTSFHAITERVELWKYVCFLWRERDLNSRVRVWLSKSEASFWIAKPYPSG